MKWLFGAFLAVSVIHMGEEYLYPGGFMERLEAPQSRVRAVRDCADGHHHQWPATAVVRRRNCGREKRPCLGLLYQAVPIGYLALARKLKACGKLDN